MEIEKALLTYGPLGIFCLWLMVRVEVRMNKHNKQLALLIRQNTILILSIPGLRREGKLAAKQVESEMGEKDQTE